LSGTVTKLAGINRRKFGSLSYWFDNLGFTTKGRLTVVLFTSYSWGFQLRKHQQVFWHHCRGERRFLQGESLASNLLLCYHFALFYFCLHHFIKNTKKLLPL
jgi:hypothetical protein